MEFGAITSRELFETNVEVEYLIPGILVRNQPGGIFGAKKTLKTTLAIELAISLGTGGRFLDRFQVARPVRVAIMSGESGIATIKETAIRQALSKGWRLADLGNVFWAFELPTIGQADQLADLRRFIERCRLEVLIIDPTYLCMPIGDFASNLFAVGALLQALTKLGQDTGCTILLCHHTRKGSNRPNSPPELDDIAWAGFPEWVRQWVLIGRRKPYKPFPGGKHDLWLSVGGSAGHSGIWQLDVEEGTQSDQGGRRWQVNVSSPDEKAASTSDEAPAATGCDTRNERLLTILKQNPSGVTKTELRGSLAMSGGKLNSILKELIDEGKVIACKVQRRVKNRAKSVDGLRLNCDSEESQALPGLGKVDGRTGPLKGGPQSSPPSTSCQPRRQPGHAGA